MGSSELLSVNTVGLFFQCAFIGILVSSRLFLSNSADQGFGSRTRRSDLLKDIDKAFLTLVIVSFFIITFSSDVISNVNKNIDPSATIQGISGYVAILIILFLDLAVLTYLVVLTNGPTLSPFTASFSLIPVFALFVKMNVSDVIMFTITTVVCLMIAHVAKTSKVDHEHQNADMVCNVLTILVAVWIGVVTR